MSRSSFTRRNRDAGLTSRQAAFAAELAARLGYSDVHAMWREYGYVERTMFGNRTVAPSKANASRVISDLLARLKSGNAAVPAAGAL